MWLYPKLYNRANQSAKIGLSELAVKCATGTFTCPCISTFWCIAKGLISKSPPEKDYVEKVDTSFSRGKKEGKKRKREKERKKERKKEQVMMVHSTERKRGKLFSADFSRVH